ncbi:signal peptidase I [Cellulomonas sp. JH27-2]|uniref:signal peptidase I n=1 Tax=Cellulomonas sp. JH27-2 TaxID=2774139 RepID=UPI001CD89368|nr:signal peptidase I [Cellulomonas sp. JH27-2]
MRALRFVGNAVLTLLAVVGVLSVLVWGASQLEYIKPLVVISGSMEPGIMTGDLLVDVKTPTGELEVGDVASIYNPLTQNLVSHRIVGIEKVGDERWEIRLKGDANDGEDAAPYEVGAEVWTPKVQIAGGGTFVTKLTQRSVVVPLGITLLCLVGLTLLPSSRGDELTEEVVEPEKEHVGT